MPTYQLNIQVDASGLSTIAAAGQAITIVKSVGSGQPVSWVSFQPMENNTVTWTEVYSVYASSTKIQEGAKIVTLSTVPAAGGNSYRLSGGKFETGEPTLAASSYGVANEDSGVKIDGLQIATCGLYQGAVVNGQSDSSPLNAVAVPYNENALFTPIERVQVFTSSTHSNGLVISTVASEALAVDFTTQLTQSIYYNDATNQFALQP